MRLGKAHGDDRLEAACRRALEIGATSYKSVESILRNGLDRRERRVTTPTPTVQHPNVRGAQYFH
jgi:hypothetical protein